MTEKTAGSEPPLVRVADHLGLTLRHRMAGGEWGAHLAHTVDGRQVVLKIMLRHESQTLERVRQAVELTDALRRAGYPIPVFIDVGRVDDDVYTVQEFVHGAIPEPFSIDHVSQLLALWHRHQGAAAPERANWSDVLTESQRSVHDLTAHVARSALAPLVHRLWTILERGDHSILRTTDVEHSDFHHRNLLTDGSRVVAVFDWEGARAGDSRRDLLRLAATAIGTGQADSESAALLSATVNCEVPTDVRELLGAMQAVADLRFGTVASLEPPQWIIRSTAYLLDDIVADHV